MRPATELRAQESSNCAGKVSHAEGVSPVGPCSVHASSSRGEGERGGALGARGAPAGFVRPSAIVAEAPCPRRQVVIACVRKSTMWLACQVSHSRTAGVRQNLEELDKLSDTTKQMAADSQQFASMATQVRKKKRFGLF